MFTADALDARRRYLAFIETRAESLDHKDAEPADRARDLDDLKGAVAAARALLSGTPAAIVMVVDDQIAIHQLARRILEPEGYMVVPAADAPAALLALRSTAAHVVLYDVHMPGPTGLWLAERIRVLPDHRHRDRDGRCHVTAGANVSKRHRRICSETFPSRSSAPACGKASAGRRHKDGSDATLTPPSATVHLDVVSRSRSLIHRTGGWSYPLAR